jgi:hypothetical protein
MRARSTAAFGSPAAGSSVYVAPSTDGNGLCLVATEAGGTAFSCAPADTFVAQNGVALLIRSEGLPGPVSKLQLIGVTSADVSALELRGNGPTRRVQASPDGGFWITLDRSDLAAGKPQTVKTFGPGGAVRGTLSLPSYP